MPIAVSLVPSIGSTATSHSGPEPSPPRSPLNSIGASSFSPSPITTTPFIDTVPIRWRMALTATPSAPFLSPLPTQRPAAMAAASVTRTSSSARLRSGDVGATASASGKWESDMRPMLSVGPRHGRRHRGHEHASGAFHDHIRGLDRGHGPGSGDQSELVGRVGGHQGHDPVRAADQLDLSHHGVLLDRDHDAVEA